MTDTTIWQALMDGVMQAHAAEQADYVPGDSRAPGSGTEGDDPLGLHYADLGPLAFALNEAMDSTVDRGADRLALIEQIAQVAQTDAQNIEDVLTDDNHCPQMEIIQAFATVLAIDPSILVDAAEKGGCRNLGPVPSAPPGF